jgi:hypothetical protein
MNIPASETRLRLDASKGSTTLHAILRFARPHIWLPIALRGEHSCLPLVALQTRMFTPWREAQDKVWPAPQITSPNSVSALGEKGNPS